MDAFLSAPRIEWHDGKAVAALGIFEAYYAGIEEPSRRQRSGDVGLHLANGQCLSLVERGEEQDVIFSFDVHNVAGEEEQCRKYEDHGGRLFPHARGRGGRQDDKGRDRDDDDLSRLDGDEHGRHSPGNDHLFQSAGGIGLAIIGHLWHCIPFSCPESGLLGVARGRPLA